MKLLFVHDHPFFRDEKVVYSGGSFPSSVWFNYKKYFQKIKVYGRNSNSPDSKIVISSLKDESIEFALTDNYSSIVGLFFNLRKLYKEIYEQISEADITLIRLPSLLGFIAGFVCILHNKKFVVEQVGNAKEALTNHGSWTGKMVSSVFDKINKYIVSRAKFVSYVTKNKLQKDYPSTGITASISNVVINKIVEIQDIDRFRFNQNSFNIGLIGGFDTKYKGQHVLLKAISKLDENVKNQINIFFVGKGDSSWVLALAAKMNLLSNIKFIGPKESGKEIFNFLNTLSLYVQPSFTEGMPRALLEAMSAGCPVLGSRVGGIPDVIENDFLHAPGDYLLLASQINKLFTDRKLLIEESLRSIEIVKPFQKERLDEKRDTFYGNIFKYKSNQEANIKDLN